MRDRLASLFKKDVKEEVMDQSSSKNLKGETPHGLFGGDQRMYGLLNTATRKSSVLAKAVLPPRKFSNYRGSQQQDDGPAPSHGRSRDRSRSPARRRRDASPRYYRYARKGKKSGGSSKGSGGKTARDSSSKK